MRFLFVKNSLVWPRSSGHDVHSYYMMRELIHLGQEVSLATVLPLTPEARDGLDLDEEYLLSQHISEHEDQSVSLSWLQEKFRNYWGVEREHLEAVKFLAKESRADVVVVVGLEVLPYLAGVENAVRVWYAADEWFWHHISVVNAFDRSTWGHLRAAFVKGGYERAFKSVIDQAWVVSKRDRTAMRIVGGVKSAPVLPNGVDTVYYKRVARAQTAKSCVFWGRLDFEPNIQALEWFCKDIWPSVLRREPQARFQIYGFNPTQLIIELSQGQGISLAPDLPDIREEISRHQVVVLPFVSGGGIKNKLLEAASMSLPIICTSRATNGISDRKNSPLLIADNAESWITHLLKLWNDEGVRQLLGNQLREWVTVHHSWRTTATKALASLK